MKKVTLTNATVIPFFKRNPNDKDEILKIIEPKSDSTFKSTIVNFNVETKTTDSAESKSKLFEKCAIFITDNAKLASIKQIIKAGAILEIEGYETRTKSEKDGKYYSNINVKNITPISGGITQPELTPIAEDIDEDELPF